MSADDSVGARTVLVTGAGGFIGGRVVEVMLELGGLEVRPALRRWSTAARIGRYPIDPVLCDLLNPEQVRDATRDVDAIVHCAVGNRRATVDGTRNLLEAALDNGVGRVVHISTIDVYGRAEGTVSEEHPLVRTNREYGDAKIEAEEVCGSFVDRGLEVVILRPTIVYGPFSDLWTLEFALRFRDGDWSLPRDACRGRCNLVYVDDVVQAILLSLDADESVNGEAFNVNGPDHITWQDYFDALNAALRLPPLPSPDPSTSRLTTKLVGPVRSLVKGTYTRFEAPILGLYKRSRLARRIMKWTEGMLRRVASSAELDLYGRVADFPVEKVRQALGYDPVVAMDRGVAMSAHWLEHEGVVEHSVE